MPHPNDGDLQAWIDGELDGEPEAAARIRRHLESCAECLTRIGDLRRESERFSRAILALDDGVATPADPGPIPLAAVRRSERRWWRRSGGVLARAAGLILVVAGAAAAIVPGSPVRTWLGALMADAPVPASVVDEAAPRAGDPAGAPTVGPAVVGVAPEDGRVEVSLRNFGRDSNVHVRLTEAGRATVRVEEAGEGPRFVTAPGRLEVIGTVGEIWVDLPRSAREAAVTVDGETAVRVMEGQIRILRPVLDSLREDVVFRIGD
jgi:hypothetical protein